MNVRDLLRVQMLLLHVEVPIPVQVVHAVVLLMKELAAEALLQVLRLTRKEAEEQVQEAALLIRLLRVVTMRVPLVVHTTVLLLVAAVRLRAVILHLQVAVHVVILPVAVVVLPVLPVAVAALQGAEDDNGGINLKKHLTMRKIITLATLGLLVAAAPISAQTVYDAATGKDLNGTARFVGMGGAMGALGGDISTIGTNPAGIGIYRSNDFMTSFGFSSYGTESKYLGDKFKSDKIQGSFDNLGFVFASKIGNETSLRYVNFGFSYHKAKSFKPIRWPNKPVA